MTSSHIPAKGYAAFSANQPLAPFDFKRREPSPHDVVIDIQYCGICHSDIHQVRDEWGGSGPWSARDFSKTWRISSTH